MDLKELRARHHGQTVWVVASDASLDYFPDGFWADRAVITVNGPHTPAWYTVSKNDVGDEGLQADIDANPRTQFVVSRYRYGNINHQQTQVTGAIIFDHAQNRVNLFDPSRDIPDDPNRLLVSYSTLGSAMHLAAYMGARTCMVVGASGGSFGDKVYVGDYSPGVDDTVPAQTSLQTQGIADELCRRYGTYFVTALPWANMRLGGVTFSSRYGRIN
jgi:hypothetical protein